MNIELITKNILDEAMRKPQNMAEVFFIEERSTYIEVKEQRVDSLNVSSNSGVSLRILNNKKTGFAYTSILTREEIRRLVSKAQDNAMCNDIDPFVIFSKSMNRVPDLDIQDNKIKGITESEKISVAKQIENSALGHDKRIKKVRSVLYRDSEINIFLLNSSGGNISWTETVFSTGVDLIAREGCNSETGSDFGYTRFFDQLKIEEIGINAAQKAIGMLGAKRIPSCNIPVVFDQAVACDFLNVFSTSLLADSVQKGKSMLAGKIGLDVAAPIISILDNGLLKQGIGSSPADHEGSPACSTPLISKGLLKGFLHNLYTAQKARTVSTGNGMRRNFKTPPLIGVTNLYIENGCLSEKELIGEIDRGLYIIDAMGVHTADPISGDFSIGVAGFWIEKGEKAFPVRGVAIAGNILDLFKHVDGVGNNIRFFGRIGSPSLRVSSMVVCGD